MPAPHSPPDASSAAAERRGDLAHIPVATPLRRTRRYWLTVLPVTVLALVVAVPAALGTQPLHWAAGSLEPSLGAPSATPAPGATGLPQFSDPVLNEADPVNTATAAAGAAVPKVHKPWKPGMPQWGVQVYWEDMTTDNEAEVRGKARRISDYVVGLKANSVALSFPVYTDAIDADTVYTASKTPSPQRLRMVLDTFRAAGLRITLRPILDERSLLPQWRGALAPQHLKAWFASYGALLDTYADLAQAGGATTLVVGTELVSLEADQEWKSLISSLRGRFHGELGFDTNWDDFLAHTPAVPSDSLGVDAYFPVTADDGASPGTIVAGWQKWLDKKSHGAMPTTVLSEAGIGAEDGAFGSPGDFYRYGTVNPQVQATWYSAVCTVVRDRRMAGVYWWSLNFHVDPRIPPLDTNSRLDFAGRPATEQAIRSCFSSSYAGPGGS